MTDRTITTIDFHGASLIVRAGDSPSTTLVAMKPVVEAMGLAWQAQHAKLKAHPLLSKGITEFVIPSAGGPQRMTALPLNRLHFWLATIQPKKVKPEIQERVITYQTEAADVLFEHFFGTRVVGQAPGTELVLSDKAKNDFGGIVKRCARVVVREELREQLEDMLAQVLPALVNAKLADATFRVRRGKTAKEIYDAHGLPPKIRGITVWLGNRLKEMGAAIEDDGRFDRGDKAIRLFDPDKAEVFLKNGLLFKAKTYASERMGQRRLNLIGGGKA